MAIAQVKVNETYKEKYGFSKPEKYVFKSRKGLDEDIVKEISAIKDEPEWMLKFRLRAYEIFKSKKQPTWGADLSHINYDDIYYYLKPIEKKSKSWEDLPKEIKDTYDAIGVPEAEKKYLGGVAAQYDSEVIYHSMKKEWEKKGVIFLDTDSALKKYPELFREHFARAIPAADNKLAALNSAVWSGGSFIYVPKGVNVNVPLQAYFRINAANMGQFERTLIIVDEGAEVNYVEGCTAPVYTSDSLHAAVVEIFVKKGARCRYTTIQNWSKNVYNLVTKRAFVEEDG
ncbi:Fe-S cluster assembly protein SufB, partial [Patescibacteria group bacterium]|nr:Fe-S cluster assembly protein SufB [Patescibacteria group bacterium]